MPAGNPGREPGVPAEASTSEPRRRRKLTLPLCQDGCDLQTGQARLGPSVKDRSASHNWKAGAAPSPWWQSGRSCRPTVRVYPQTWPELTATLNYLLANPSRRQLLGRVPPTPRWAASRSRESGRAAGAGQAKARDQ